MLFIGLSIPIVDSLTKYWGKSNKQIGRIRDVDLPIREMENTDESLLGDDVHRMLQWRIDSIRFQEMRIFHVRLSEWRKTNGRTGGVDYGTQRCTQED
ncbi:hypothetical protein L1887_16731 [Cichorium endivia]|nr:hypothetical protein L1887_16731 [Cichorium endivia]